MKEMAIGFSERNAIYEFNAYLRGINRTGTLVQARLKAFKEMTKNSGVEAAKALYAFFAVRFPHWKISRGSYKEGKLINILLIMSVDRISALIKKENCLEDIAGHPEEDLVRKLVNFKMNEHYCAIHPEEEVAQPNSADEISKLVCKSCISNLNQAMLHELISENASVKEMLRYLKNRHLIREGNPPQFKSGKTHVSPRKLGAHELKDEVCCEIHPDRPAISTGIFSGKNFKICRGCAVCLGRAMNRGAIRRSASEQEMMEFLRDRFSN